MSDCPKVGQIVYVVNNARHCKVEISQATVTKVGRKYFTVESDTLFFHGTQFRINDWSQVTEYSADYVLYESESAYREEIERTSILNTLREVFSGYFGCNPLSIEELRMINNVIKLAKSRGQPK